jgi:HSP20 family protein
VLFRFDPFDSPENVDRRRPAMLAMDAVRTDDEVFVYFDAPGFDIDDSDLTIEKNAVTIEATRRWYDADQQTLTSERPQGTFRRQIQLGDNFDVDNLTATLDRGVLQLSIPVAEGTKPRKVDISMSSHERELSPSN